MASERLQVVLQLVAGQYKSEARQAASATSEVARQAQSAGGSIGQLDASLRVVAQKMGSPRPRRGTWRPKCPAG